MNCSKQYYVVLDFEANCTAEQKHDHEIIEFPAILVEANTGNIVSEFRTFVTTIKTGNVSKFIRELTHITDEDLHKHGVVWSKQMTGLPEDGALELFEKWCNDNKISSKNTTMITCGDWDLKTMLPRQLLISNTLLKNDLQKLFGAWNNVKKSYAKYHKLKRKMGMAAMLKDSNIELVGHHHSGIDDTRNIAKICHRLVQLGVDITQPNTMLEQRYIGQYKLMYRRTKRGKIEPIDG